LKNTPNISAAKLSAVLVELADRWPIVTPEGPTTSYTFGRVGPKVMLAIKGAEGDGRLTRAVLVLGPDDSSLALAAMLGLPRPDDRISFEFCDTEGERLDVYAPRLSSIKDSATILAFMQLPLAA
jgi:hypothetical protein